MFSVNLMMPIKQKLIIGSWMIKKKKGNQRDFPGGTVVKNLPANAGGMGSIPGLGRSHMPQSN